MKSPFINGVILLLIFLTTTFNEVSGQDRARPASNLDVPSSGTIIYEENYRLLINVFVQPGRGLRVASLAPKSPTTDMTQVRDSTIRGILEPGDIITHINNAKIESLQDYYSVLNASRGDVSIRVVDKNTGSASDWAVKAVKVRSPFVPDADARFEQRIARVLLVGLTDDKFIGQPIEKSLKLMEDMFRNEVAKENLDLEVVKGASCNAQTIINKVRQLGLKAKPQDSIFVYYLGHGAYDPALDVRDPSGGHFLQLPGGDLVRKTLFENILSQPGRLKILITDTCNVRALLKIPKKLVYETKQMRVQGPTNLERLLLYHRGFLDVSASSRDQFSWFSYRFGGWFTFKFSQIIPNHSDWSAFLDQLSKEVDVFFNDQKKTILNDVSGNVTEQVRGDLQAQTEMKPAVFRMSLTAESTVMAGPLRTITRVTQSLVPE